MVEVPVLPGRLAQFGAPKVGHGCIGGGTDVGSAWADIYAGSHVSKPGALVGGLSGMSRLVYVEEPGELHVEWVSGWREWLDGYHLLDSTKSDKFLYWRYLRFREVVFPEVPRDQWWRYFRDLVTEVDEEMLVCSPAIGRLDGFDFSFDTVQE